MTELNWMTALIYFCGWEFMNTSSTSTSHWHGKSGFDWNKPGAFGDRDACSPQLSKKSMSDWRSGPSTINVWRVCELPVNCEDHIARQECQCFESGVDHTRLVWQQISASGAYLSLGLRRLTNHTKQPTEACWINSKTPETFWLMLAAVVESNRVYITVIDSFHSMHSKFWITSPRSYSQESVNQTMYFVHWLSGPS